MKKIRTNAILLVCVAGSALTISRAAGASIAITDVASGTGASSVATNQSNTSPSASTVLTDSKTTTGSDPGNYGAVSYSVRAGFGESDLSFTASASCTYSILPCGPSLGGFHYAEASLTSGLNSADDLVHFSNLPGGSALAELQYSISGTIGGAGGSSDGSISVSLANNDVDIHFLINQISRNGSNVPISNGIITANGSTMTSSLTPDLTLANTWDFLAQGTMIIPIVSGQIELTNDVTGESDIVAGSSFGLTNWFSASATSTFYGLKVYDSTGTNLLSGVGINSASGFDYTQSPSAPEPATFGLIGAGLAALAWRKQKKGRRS